ncbi:MAG: translation initiation factor [Ghiorsea sp.]
MSDSLGSDEGRVLVYSSESGMVNKSSQPSSKRKRKSQQNVPSNIKNPAKQGIRIQRESKGRGGKSVCVITGLNKDSTALKKLCKTLKAQLGTGGAVKDNTIEIQGNHREKLVVLLDKQGLKAKLSGG